MTIEKLTNKTVIHLKNMPHENFSEALKQLIGVKNELHTTT